MRMYPHHTLRVGPEQVSQCFTDSSADRAATPSSGSAPKFKLESQPSLSPPQVFPNMLSAFHTPPPLSGFRHIRKRSNIFICQFPETGSLLSK